MTPAPARFGLLARRWNEFWFAEASPIGLGLFRIAFAIALALEVETTFAKSPFAIAGGFHLPYASWVPLLTETGFRGVHQWQFPFIAMLGVGLFTRTACGLLLLSQGWVFFTDQLNFRNHPYFFLLLLAILLVSPAGKALSIDALLRHPRQPRLSIEPWREPLTAQRLICVQVSLVYLYAAFAKLNPGYLRGEVLAHHVGKWLDGTGWFAGGFTAPAILWSALAVATLGLEVFLAVALWLPRLRPWAFALGTAFHISIAVTMNIWVFSLAVLATYVLFLGPEAVAAPFRRLLAQPGTLR